MLLGVFDQVLIKLDSARFNKATTTSMNRHFLSHAAQCGITDLLRFGDQQPVICRGPNLTYVWQPLAGVKLPPESPEAIQIDTSKNEVAAAS